MTTNIFTPLFFLSDSLDLLLILFLASDLFSSHSLRSSVPILSLTAQTATHQLAASSTPSLLAPSFLHQSVVTTLHTQYSSALWCPCPHRRRPGSMRSHLMEPARPARCVDRHLVVALPFRLLCLFGPAALIPIATESWVLSPDMLLLFFFNQIISKSFVITAAVVVVVVVVSFPPSQTASQQLVSFPGTALSSHSPETPAFPYYCPASFSLSRSVLSFFCRPWICWVHAYITRSSMLPALHRIARPPSVGPGIGQAPPVTSCF